MYMTTTHHYRTKVVGMKNHKMAYSIILYHSYQTSILYTVIIIIVIFS